MGVLGFVKRKRCMIYVVMFFVARKAHSIIDGRMAKRGASQIL